MPDPEVPLQLEQLKGRTNNDFLLLAVRSHVRDYLPPYVYYTNDRVQDFFELFTKMPITDLAAKLEAHVISGVEGELSFHSIPSRHLHF